MMTLLCSLFKLLPLWFAEEESNNQERRIGYRDSIFYHNIVNRNRKEGALRLYNDYFAENPKFTYSQFRRRFRISCRLFLRIANAVEAHNPYFKQRTNALSVLGLFCLQKVTAAHKILAYGIFVYLIDEYLRIRETIVIESLRAFIKAIIEVFGDWYLKAPNEVDICRLLSIEEQRGFSGMFWSIDYMHWKWKKCPITWHGMYIGHCCEPTIILEAVASQDL
ncbi:hypothetical protein D5086_001477 [Populus alba]|uniref:Uncharacterized protein n=1 Tax=Populus alba TaxID=43335 RepID=A0ACC4CYT2_POPAL